MIMNLFHYNANARTDANFRNKNDIIQGRLTENCIILDKL